MLIPALAMQVRAQTETVLYTFTGSSDGGVPYAGLISDNEGNFYGTTMQYGSGPCTYPFAGCGTVFELSPVKHGRAAQWTFKVPHAFQGGSDGANPVSELISDSAGNLYGTTGAGGFGCGGTGCGTVFELKKSESGWTEKVLYRFTGQSDGANPGSSLALDSHGNIYGTTTYGGDSNCDFNGPGSGVVFRLSPIHDGTESTWAETVLHTFDANDGANPFAGVTLGPPELCGAPAGQACIFGTTMYGGYLTIEPGAWRSSLFPVERRGPTRCSTNFPEAAADRVDRWSWISRGSFTVRRISAVKDAAGTSSASSQIQQSSGSGLGLICTASRVPEARSPTIRGWSWTSAAISTARLHEAVIVQTAKMDVGPCFVSLKQQAAVAGMKAASTVWRAARTVGGHFRETLL